MIIQKITTGFVIQRYDTDKKAWLDQEFVASDDVVYEDEKTGFRTAAFNYAQEHDLPYLPFKLLLPNLEQNLIGTSFIVVVSDENGLDLVIPCESGPDAETKFLETIADSCSNWGEHTKEDMEIILENGSYTTGTKQFYLWSF